MTELCDKSGNSLFEMVLFYLFSIEEEEDCNFLFLMRLSIFLRKIL